MGSSTIILKEYYIYVSILIAIYSKGFFWIFLLILPLCSIYRHGGQDGWSEGSSDISFKGNPLRMIQAKFGLNWPSGFRGEDFWKSLQTDDGCQLMAIAHTGELKIAVYVDLDRLNMFAI